MTADRQLAEPTLDLTVRREDVADAIAAYRRGTTRTREWVIGIGGLVLALSTWMAGLASSSDVVVLSAFVGGWVILLALNLRNWRRYTREIARLGLTCPGCRQPIVEMIEWRGRLQRADAVLTTGRCPSCGVDCFSPEAST